MKDTIMITKSCLDCANYIILTNPCKSWCSKKHFLCSDVRECLDFIQRSETTTCTNITYGEY